jgi:hypothetical protein
MGNGFKPSNTLLFDHIHRREATSEAIEEYHEKVLECHENFTDSIADSMKAKVEIIWGRKVQQRLIQTNDFEVLPLWGDFEGVILMLAYEKELRKCRSPISFPASNFTCISPTKYVLPA